MPIIIAPTRCNKSLGFTLLEVMVAMVIFSVGMLGLAGIQGTALQNNNTAYMRTIAMQLSYNMSDLLRANTDFDGDVTTTFDTIGTAIGSAPGKNCIADDQTTACTPTELANFEIYHWKKSLEKELPSGRGKVTKTGDVFEIIIMWDEARSGVTGENCSGVSTTDLKCYSIQIQV